MTPRESINIRDPFVLVHEGKYYLYGTRGPECITSTKKQVSVLIN